MTTQQNDNPAGALPTDVIGKTTDIFVGLQGMSFRVIGTRKELIDAWNVARTAREVMTLDVIHFTSPKFSQITLSARDITIIGEERDYTEPKAVAIGQQLQGVSVEDFLKSLDPNLTNIPVPGKAVL